MSGYYDDNFGHWDMSDPDSVEFYHQVQRTNVRKKCSGCKRMVSIQPHYALCNSCADIAERGGEFMCDDGDGGDEPDAEHEGGEDAHLDAAYEERTHIDDDGDWDGDHDEEWEVE